MAQGKLKVKSKPPAKKNSKNATHKVKQGGVKKGRSKQIAPKKPAQQHIAKFKKQIEKGINKNIETELGAIAKKVEEGKPFLCIGGDLAAGSSKKGKKKK